MRRLLFVVAAAMPLSAAASGFSVELGGGLSTSWSLASTAISGRITLARRDELELRTSAFFGPVFPVFHGVVLDARYRTPPVGDAVRFVFAVGGGGTLWLGCVTGDFCGGIGPVLEASPALEFGTKTVRPYLALNLGGGPLFLANPGLLLWAQLAFGVAFDFSPSTRE
ncbi:MAG: hypothetical protein ACOZQL_13280 [Myxococcota bacterium]